MFSLGDSEVYYLSRTATDMRKGFDALCGEVRRGMGRDPISGEVFIFYNTHRTRLKLLHWERGGFVIYHKRFEQGILTLPRFDSREGGYRVTWRELVLMVEGVELERLRPRKRYDISLKNNANSVLISLQSPRFFVSSRYGKHE